MPPKSTARGGVPGGGTPKTPENAKVKARSKKITKIPASNGAPPAYPKPKRKYVKRVKVIEPEYVEEVDCEPEYLPYNLPPFTRDTFIIYPWPYHRPDNILHLASSLREWKMTQDLKEGCADIDDGSDDWDEFSGNVLHYPSEASLHTAIARTFVNRAKRAFRAYKTWEEFVAEESNVDPCRSALDEKMNKKRDRALRDVLDNNLRIAVFDKIAERLCNEIWLQEYSAETTGRLRLDQYPYGISPAHMSTADLEADLKQIRRLQHDNQHREKGGNIGMTGLETVLWTLGAGSDDEGE